MGWAAIIQAIVQGVTNFVSTMSYIKENKIEYFFISGDLYEHEYVKQSTIEYINNCFKIKNLIITTYTKRML